MPTGKITIQIRQGVRNAWMGEERWYEFDGRSRTVLVDKGLSKYLPRGYFEVYLPEMSFLHVYADWYWWPIAKVERVAIDTYWRGLRWAVTHRWLRITTHRSMAVRFRDVRLQLRRCACGRYDKCSKHSVS